MRELALWLLRSCKDTILAYIQDQNCYGYVGIYPNKGFMTYTPVTPTRIYPSAILHSVMTSKDIINWEHEIVVVVFYPEEPAHFIFIMHRDAAIIDVVYQ